MSKRARLVLMTLVTAVTLTVTLLQAPSAYAHRKATTSVRTIEGLPAAQWEWREQTDKCRHFQDEGNLHGVQHCMFDRYWAGNSREHQCLDERQHRENGGRIVTLFNRAGSSAYGIPQALPGHKMATHGLDWRTSALVQVSWQADYIRGKYGSPCRTLGRRSY